MKDIGMHPDTRSMHPDLKNYETMSGEGDKCPWCEEGIEEIYAMGLDGIFQSAVAQDTEEAMCGNCGAKLKISYLLVPLAESYTARVEFKIEATVKVA